MILFRTKMFTHNWWQVICASVLSLLTYFDRAKKKFFSVKDINVLKLFDEGGSRYLQEMIVDLLACYFDG